MVPGFLDHANQAERAELVGGFAATTTATIVAAVNVKDILRVVARGLRLYLGSFAECNPSSCVPCFFFFHTSAVDHAHLNAVVVALLVDRPV